MPRAPQTRRIRLKPANPFDLIRLLARSQHDPRKAVAELVQNSLDAEATRIDLTWFSERGLRALRVWDDGRGVFPDLLREEALRRIATTIGHSYKRSLTPAERQRLMALGQYGIGLLGFWAVGGTMEIRSRVSGSEAWTLRLHEDSPDAELGRARARRLDEAATFTEVTILGVHEGAERQIRPGRLHAYLAAELRGQLLARTAAVRIHDRVARGRSMKEFAVRPRRFRGRLLRELAELPVPGRDPARVEVYLLDPEDDPGRVSLACGGTTVLDDVAGADGSGTSRAPWDSGRLEGVVDFPELSVAPGTRRGFAHDGAALAFLDALRGLEIALAGALAADDHRRGEEQDRNLAREIRRVFRPMARLLPEYELFDIRGRGEPGGRVAADGGSPGAAPPAAGGEPLAPGEEGEPLPEAAHPGGPALFPPGPLASLRIRPSLVRLPPGGRRTFRASALDADGRPAAGAVEFTWTLLGPGILGERGDRADYEAPEEPVEARILVRAVQGEVRAEAEARILVVDSPAAAPGAEGIPEPLPVHDPGGPWRSRLRDGAWEYNTAHRDYAEAAAEESRRLRYLVHLFAKEIVLRNFGRPGDGPTLERMVEVLTHMGDVRPRGRAPAVRPAEGGAPAGAAP